MSDLDRLDTLRLRFDAHPTRFGVPYAEALRRAGQLEEAIAVMRAALALEDRNVLGLVVLARCLRDLGHPEEAGIAVRTALALDPDDSVVGELAYLVPFAPDARDAVMRDPDIGSESAPAMEEASRPPVVVEDAPVRVPDDPLGERAHVSTEPPAQTQPVPPVFVTQTMAELYVQQGLPGRAVAIYRELTARAPDDARLAARLAEVVALAEREAISAPPSTVGCDDEDARIGVEAVAVGRDHVTAGAEADGGVNDDEQYDARGDSLGDLPLLEDFDPIPMFEPVMESAEQVVAQWSGEDVSEPESLSDEPAIASAFDFSGDAHRVAPPVTAMDESMLAGLSFEAISLPTPEPDGAGLDLPVGAGPSAREALRRLASRPVVSRAPRRPPIVPPARPTTRTGWTGATPAKRAGSPPPVDLTGDDFDQWLRGVS